MMSLASNLDFNPMILASPDLRTCRCHFRCSGQHALDVWNAHAGRSADVEKIGHVSGLPCGTLDSEDAEKYQIYF